MRTFILTILIILFSSFKQRNDNYIFFPKRVGISQICNGETVEFEFKILTASREKVAIHSFYLDKQDFILLKDSHEILKSDTIYISNQSPLTLKVKYKLLSIKKPTYFTFKSNLPKYIDNKILVGYSEIHIESYDFRSNQELIFNFSKNCEDSIRIYFPKTGMTSNATIFDYSDSTKKEFKSISWALDNNNFITMNKNEIGLFYVKYSSCTMINGFWMRLE